MAKQRGMRLYLDGTYEKKSYSIDRNKLRVEKADEVFFEPRSVFTERKHKLLGIIPRFWHAPEKLVLFVDGASNALKFSEVKEEMQTMWTKKESAEFNDKQVAKSLMKHKPMTWAQFIIILVPIFIILGILVKMALNFGVF